MTIHEYQKQALRTAAAANREHDLMHAVLGLVTEAGELADVLKKRHAYGKELDQVNLIEETGDVLWYLALMARALGVDLERIAERNIAKLAARYPGKFTQAAALERNLEAERKTLEATPATPSTLQQIRRMMGYVENGTDCTVRFFQDEGTKDFFVAVGGRMFFARTLEQAFAVALEGTKAVTP